MYLDRLLGHAPASNSHPTSAPQSRSYSPAGRGGPSRLAPQPNQPQRPGFGPRSSSLSVAQSNDSATSLLGNATKNTNGSNLRQVSGPDGYTDSLKLLDQLLSGPPASDNNEEKNTEDVTLEGVDFEGLSLHDFVKEEPERVQQRQKSQFIVEYEQDKTRFNSLHDSIRACDEILNSVEANLTQFQYDLGAVSAEIETLQARSTALNIRLENRKAVETALGPVVEEITISPMVVRKISEGPMDESWIAALAEVDKRSKAIDGKASELQDVKGLHDLKPLLEQLVAIAVERIRNHLVDNIKSLRSPNINAQIIQQQHFLRYKDLYTFLRKHHEQLAEEIGQAYMNTMRWYYLTNFTRYERALSKVKLHSIDSHSVLGSLDTTPKSSILSGSKSGSAPHDAFNLGRRHDVLTSGSQNAVPSHLAEEDKQSHYLDFPFHHFNLALASNVTAEYTFLLSFFSPSLSYAAIARYFNTIFAPTFELGLHLTKSLVQDTYDSLGLLLCVRLVQKMQFRLQRAKVPVGEGYLMQVTMELWPRFQKVMDAHCLSISALASKLPDKAPTSKSELARQSAAPTAMTQRFGQFVCGILELSRETGDDEPVSSSLARLRGEVEAFLERSARGLGERIRKRFLANNYSLLLTIIGDADGKLAGEQREFFEGCRGRAEELNSP